MGAPSRRARSPTRCPTIAGLATRASRFPSGCPLRVARRNSSASLRGSQAKHHAHQHQAEDGSDDAERVGDGIADLRQPALSGREARHVAQRLLHRRQRRRVGDGARHQSHRAGGVDVQPAMDGHDAQHVHRHQRQRQQIPAQALGPQRGHEPGAHLDADAVDEQHQPQLAHELEHLPPALLQRGQPATARQAREHVMAPQQLRNSEAGEQDAGDTE